MARVDLRNESSRDDSGRKVCLLMGPVRCLAYAAVVLLTMSVPADLGAPQVHGYSGLVGQVSSTDALTGEGIPADRRKVRYHIGLVDLELEQAVRRAAQQHQIQPALLLAVMKAESSFNPTVVSRAGAVGLMQLIPETAIRHGVRNLYDTNENISGGAKHLRYLLDRFHGDIRLALAAYNAGERKVDLYGQIPPYKETRDYVKKVLVYYRGYKKAGWVMPVVMTTSTSRGSHPH